VSCEKIAQKLHNIAADIALVRGGIAPGAFDGFEVFFDSEDMLEKRREPFAKKPAPQ
jgi:hypothetical protein